MNEAPERIWVSPENRTALDADERFRDPQDVEYIRADIAAGRAAWERHRARMALRAFDVESARSVRFRSERDRLIEEAAWKDEALRWYESEALGAKMAIVGGNPSPDVALAVLTVLALDGGAHARAALASMKEEAAIRAKEVKNDA